jgi:hypothetical protein
MQDTVSRIHEEWRQMREQASSGHKGRLTQIKGFYTRLIQADPDAAAEMLATNEYVFERLRKEGVPLSDAILAASLP